MHYKQQQSPFPTHQESCSSFRYADHAQKASVDLAIENFVSLNSPVGSASKSYHHCSRVQQPMEHKCLHPHWPVGRQLGMYLFASSYWHWKCPGGNVIFLWKWNVLCFAYFPLCLSWELSRPPLRHFYLCNKEPVSLVGNLMAWENGCTILHVHHLSQTPSGFFHY